MLSCSIMLSIHNITILLSRSTATTTEYATHRIYVRIKCVRHSARSTITNCTRGSQRCSIYGRTLRVNNSRVSRGGLSLFDSGSFTRRLSILYPWVSLRLRTLHDCEQVTRLFVHTNLRSYRNIAKAANASTVPEDKNEAN